MAQVVITSDNVTPLIQVITWFFFVVAVFGILIRAVTKTCIIRSVSLDDALVFVALLFAIGQTTAIAASASDGLGQSMTSLSSSQISNVLKETEYTADLLYVFALCFSKLSVLAMIRNITPAKQERRITLGLIICVAGWAFIAEFVLAFQCHPPSPWEYQSGTCIDRTAWWNYFETVNLLTDAALILLPGFVLAKVHTSVNRKITVFFFFNLRLAPIAAIIAKLVFWNRLQASDPFDTTLSVWPVVVCTQTIQGLEIFSTCCISLRPFLESFKSGFMHADDLRRRGQSIKDTYNLTSFTKGGRTADSGPERTFQGTANHHAVSVEAGAINPGWDSGSQRSQSRIITETRTFAVESSSTTNARDPRESGEERLLL